MTVYDFCELCTDDSVQVEIYDFTAGEAVFSGEFKDATWDFGDCEVLSFDIDPLTTRGIYLILNIETESEED